jgi:2-dehydro-3-deoxygluconokinase
MSFVTFGEIMLRLTPSNFGVKISSSPSFQVDYAGSESNVASSLAVLGNEVSFITKLPKNQIGDAAISSLRAYGIDTGQIRIGGNRVGTYFIEMGTSIRPSSVIYDRANSSISEIEKGEFDWPQILNDRKWIFLSGITPALSKQCAMETLKAATIAKELGVKVAFDMNYRRSLWDDPSDAREIFDQILEKTDLLFGNAGVINDVYDIRTTGGTELEKTINVLDLAAEKFGVDQLAFTVRKHLSASINEVSAVFMSGSKQYVSGKLDVSITDRFGTGDAFAAAFLHGTNLDWDSQKTIDFATAAFALKHTIIGDRHTSSEAEIKSIMDGNTQGYVLR